MDADRKFLMPVSIIVQAKKAGVLAADIQDMLRKSARITHPEGNRRYHEYLFTVEGDRLLSMRKMSEAEVAAEERKLSSYVRKEYVKVETYYACETCRDTGKMVVYDPCGRCNGVGCSHCDDGLVRAEVNCPDCPKPQVYTGTYRGRQRF